MLFFPCHKKIPGRCRCMQPASAAVRARLIWPFCSIHRTFDTVSKAIKLTRMATMASLQPFGKSTFLQRADLGRGGFLPAARCLTLSTRPEPHPVLLSLSHPDRVLHWQRESTRRWEKFLPWARKRSIIDCRPWAQGPGPAGPPAENRRLRESERLAARGIRSSHTRNAHGLSCR